MKTRIVYCNEKGFFNISEIEKTKGIEIALLSERNTPIANYRFDANTLKGQSRITYNANNIRIDFDGINPTMKSELCSVID